MPAQYLTSDPSSFASVSANERWPVIIVSILPQETMLELTSTDWCH